MPTRVSQFAERVIEAAWLSALVVVPLFFNVWSNRVFEPDKLSVLRTIALVVVAAGVVLGVERGLPTRDEAARWLRTPLVRPVLFQSGVILLASLTSVVPFISLTGSYNRLQGAFTWLAYVALFLAIVTLVKRRSQVDRLVYALILPSLPVGLYGIVQRFGREIMPWQGDTTVRIASTMGNSIFVAAFLILAVPLTIVRLVGALRDLDEQEGSAPVFRVSAYLVLLAVQVMAVVFSQSRGPLLGLAGGLFFLLLLLASRRATRRAMLTVLGLGAAVAAFLVIFNLPSSPLAGLRDVPYVGRMGRVFETESGTGRVRVLIWKGAVDLITADPVRSVIGWGPESMHVAYNPFYPAELGRLESRNASPDRAHNETFDALVTTGFLGFLAYMTLFTSLFAYGLKCLGFVTSSRELKLFLLTWLSGGAIAALGFRLWSGDSTFFGVGLPAGMIAGLFLFVVGRAVSGWSPPQGAHSLVVAGLVAAMIAHFIEIHFGIAIAATRTLFFVMAGLLVVLGNTTPADDLSTEEAAAPAPVTATPRRLRNRRAVPQRVGAASSWRWTGNACLLVLILITLAFDFNVWPDFPPLVQNTPDWGKTFILLWLFGMTWAMGALVLSTETISGPSGTQQGWYRFLLITLAAPVGYWVFHFSLLSAGRASGAATSTALLYFFLATLCAIILLWALALMSGAPKAGALARIRYPVAYVVPFLVAGVLAVRLNVNEVLADIHYKQGWVFYHGPANSFANERRFSEAYDRFDQALLEYRRALALDSREDYYLLFRGKALLEKADAMAQAFEIEVANQRADMGDSEYEGLESDLATRVGLRDQAFTEAVAALETARDANPMNTDHQANLARAYQVWGDRTLDEQRRNERFDESRRYFAIAISQSPNNPALREELATTEYLAGDLAAARSRVEEAFAVDDQYMRPHKLLATMAREADDLETAAEHYMAYVESRDGRSDVGAWSAYAFVLGRLERRPEAIQANERVLEILNRVDVDTVRNLAILYSQEGNDLLACRYAAQGLERVEDPGLRDLVVQLDCESIGATVPPPAPTGSEPGLGQGPGSQEP